jgi:lysophospholipase L1-like esterase
MLLTACSQSTTGSPIQVEGPYVALGDSYTAGPDIPTQTGQPAGCERSTNSYPALIARHYGFAASHVQDRSCTGATIASLTAVQTTSAGTNPPQVDALSAKTRLVTLGIGGNDIDFTSIVTHCVALGVPAAIIARHEMARIAPCRDYSTNGTDRIRQQIDNTAGHLAAALARIQAAAPNARIYLIGYPELLPSTASACIHELGITPERHRVPQRRRTRSQRDAQKHRTSGPRPLRRYLHPHPGTQRLHATSNPLDRAARPDQPRRCVSEAPARNHSATPSGHSIPSSRTW